MSKSTMIELVQELELLKKSEAINHMIKKSMSVEYKEIAKRELIWRLLCWFMGTVMISKSIIDLWTQ